MLEARRNPLLQPWDTLYGLPPFEAIHTEHFEPAFEVALKAHRAEVDAIGSATEAPSFDNTIATFDRCGLLFDRIRSLFHNLTSSATSPELQAVQRRMAPVLADHGSAVSMHGPLFARIDALHAQRDAVALTPSSGA